jgi:hypothetical protein
MNADPLRFQPSETDQGGETPEFDPNKPRSARLHDFWLGGKDNFAAMEQQRTLRAHGDVERFFAGLEFLRPGLTRPSQWRPDSPEEAARPSAAWVGVARKPG